MKKILLFIEVSFLILVSTAAYGQTACSTREIIHEYMEKNLVYDFLSLNTMTSSSLGIKFSYCDEEIPINYDRFEIQPKKDSKKVRHVLLESLGDSIRYSRYIIFHSAVKDDYMMVEVLVNRRDYLNDQRGVTEFERRKRFNRGISYLFILDEEGCIQEVEKEVSGYD